MANEKKRPLTLSGAIVNIVFGTIDIILMIIACIYISDLYYTASYYIDTTPYLIVSGIEIAFAIIVIILSSLLCAKSKKSVQEYNRYSGLIITLFVFNCLAVLSSFINVIGNGNYFAIITMLVYAMCGTFELVDLCRNKKALKALGGVQPVQTISAVQTVVAQPAKPSNAVKVPNGEQKKRPLTLAGTIVNIVFGALDIIAMIISCVYISDLYYTASYYINITPFIVAYVIEIAFSATIIILSSLLCARCKRSVQDYNRCSGLVITLFVFNCLAVLASLINLIGGNYFAIVTMLVYAMCGTFELVDLCRNKKALKNGCVGQVVQQMPAKATNVQAVAQPVASAQPVQPEQQANPVQTTPVAQSKLYQTLVELKEMKDLGIIDEEEYKKLKARAVENAEF